MKTINFLHSPEKECMRVVLKEDEASEASRVFLLVEQGTDPTSLEHSKSTSVSKEPQDLHYYSGHIRSLAILVSIAVITIGYARQLPLSRRAGSSADKAPSLLQGADSNDENADSTHFATPLLLPSQPPYVKEEQSDKDHVNLFGSPFVVFTEGGCSGTTVIGGYIRKIIQGHGFDYSRDGTTFEFTHTKKTYKGDRWKNEFY